MDVKLINSDSSIDSKEVYDSGTQIVKPKY